MPEENERVENEESEEPEIKNHGDSESSTDSAVEEDSSHPIVESQPEKRKSERIVHGIINVLLVVVVALTAVLAWKKITERRAKAAEQSPIEANAVTEIPSPSEAESPGFIELAPLEVLSISYGEGISRKAQLHSIIPTRPKVDVITYTVESGDSIFSIADIFNIRPETVLWGNHEILVDNPHFLKTGIDLNILPLMVPITNGMRVTA